MSETDLGTLMPRVEKHLDRKELTQLCLDLGNIESPYGAEGEAGQFVYDWCDAAGFSPRKVGFIEERFNVVGTLAGEDGESLLFNSHLDTGRRRGDRWILRDPDRDFYHRAWVEDGIIVGDGVINDKGPLGAFLLAARAIRDAGIRLRGDVYLSGVCGEIGQEPVDEFQGIEYASKDIGAHFLANHGPVTPDRVLVAEATSCKLVGLEAGKLHVKVIAYGHETYTPYLGDDRYERNAITRLQAALDVLKVWIVEYEQGAVLETSVGTCRPRVNIGAMRAGAPYRMTHTPEVAAAYVDIRLAPGQAPAPILRSVRAALSGLGDVEVEPFLYRPGHVVQGGEALIEGLRVAHEHVIGEPLEAGDGPVASMWRDINIFNEVGIPAITYGPSRASVDGQAGVDEAEMHRVAMVYAATALALCGPLG